MSEETRKEAFNKYVKQILFGIATILILFGLFYLIDDLTNLFNISISYYLWIFFQLILALLVIFIGFRVYCVGRNSEPSGAVRIRYARRFPILALALGILVLSSVALYPSGATSLYPIFHHLHAPIPLVYNLHYHWNYMTGASVTITTQEEFSHLGVQILFDVSKIGLFKTVGWVITPYEIFDSPGAHLLMIGPASGTLELGTIGKGVYVLKIVLQGTTEVFSLHKTDDEFWMEECRVVRGSLEQKSLFDRSLDRYALGYIGFPNIDNDTKCFINSSLEAIGAAFEDSEEYFDGWSVDYYFKYSGDAEKLSKIILEVAKREPGIMVEIRSNTGWRALTWIYNFAVYIKPQYAEAARRIILEKNLKILSEGTWGNYTQLNMSSASLEKDRYEMRPDLVQAFLDPGWKQYDDFYVSY
jgi:hypothetical protein